jgi:hypothetical protein
VYVRTRQLFAHGGLELGPFVDRASECPPRVAPPTKLRKTIIISNVDTELHQHRILFASRVPSKQLRRQSNRTARSGLHSNPTSIRRHLPHHTRRGRLEVRDYMEPPAANQTPITHHRTPKAVLHPLTGTEVDSRAACHRGGGPCGDVRDLCTAEPPPAMRHRGVGLDPTGKCLGVVPLLVHQDAPGLWTPLHEDDVVKIVR